MVMTSARTCGITDAFVDRLAMRAADTERTRRLPADTVKEAAESGFFDLLVPRRYGGQQAPFIDILDPVRRMAHGCTSSAWTLGFYTLHNWMMALFGEDAQSEAFASRPFLAPAPLAPTGRGLPAPGGLRLSGRWSWATGVMNANWTIVGALCGPDDAIYPALVLLPASDIEVVDVWQTDGMRGTGSNDVTVHDVFVPQHRVVRTMDVYTGNTPGAGLHDGTTYRWPMVPALSLVASMPALGAAERVVSLYAERLAERVLAYEGTRQKDKPTAQVRLSHAQVRLRALRGLLRDTTTQIDALVEAGDPIERNIRAEVRLAAAHIVYESRSVIAHVMEAAGASVHFLDNPMQRFKRDVDVLSGHVIFDYDTSRELAGALAIGLDVPPAAMI